MKSWWAWFPVSIGAVFGLMLLGTLAVLLLMVLLMWCC